jgi:hypothetical protein
LSKVKFHSKLSKYHRLCWDYLTYLSEKEGITIIIEGSDESKQDTVSTMKPYMHRWKPEYMKARLAKFYLLDFWYNEHILPLTMLTFTTYHDSPYARRKGYRFLGCSRDLAKGMKWVRIENAGYTWLCTSLHHDDQGYEEDKIIRNNPTWK